MKIAREIHKGNRNRFNLPPYRLFGWLVQLLLSGFCWGLYGDGLLAWLIGLWLAKKLITDVIYSVQGCLSSILFSVVVVGIIIWLLILQHIQL